ncbi:MAG: hypothetical protein EAX95_09370 [Candidatus Thorarchaeota archaeon]|nr:hypothetical protein [Candidatus Thorarchaeota archaeon]
MSERIFAVFDIGTTGTRSVLIDEEGRELAKAYEEYPPKPRELDTHEQLANTFWRTACTTMQRALSNYEPGAGAIVGVVVTTTRDCVTPVDKDGNPLAPTITWSDTRSSRRREELSETIGPRRGLNKIMWLSENKPRVFERADKFLTLDSFICRKLCDVMVTEPSNARYGPFNHDTLEWSSDLCEATGIPLSSFVDIVKPGEVIGEITKASSSATGLLKGTPVIMGCGDQQCSALGTGTVKTGVAKATTGTGTFVITHTDDYVEDPYVLYSNPAAIPGRWILEGAVPGTGLSYKWYRDQYYKAEAALAGKREEDLYEIMEIDATEVPAGSDGLVVFPFMGLGKGIFYNLGFNHTKAHIARAIMESNGYGIRFYLELIEGMVEVEFESLNVDGGGANSPLWRQIIADCINRPVVLPRTRDSTAIGAAMLAAVGTGVYATFEEAIENMYHVEEKRFPVPENTKVYEERFATFNKLLTAELSELIAHY